MGIVKVLGGVILVGVVVVVGVVVLAITGAPQPACGTQQVSTSSAIANAVKSKWSAFDQASRTAPNTLTLSLEEVNSFATDYVATRSLPISNLRVGFCGQQPNGFGVEGAMTVKVLGTNINIVSRGEVQVIGRSAKVHVSDIRVGNVPSALLTSAVQSVLASAANESFGQNLLGFEGTSTLMTVKGGPR